MAAALVAPAQATPGHGHAYGHGKGHCRAIHLRGEGTDDGAGTTNATLFRGQREVGTTVGTFVITGASFTGSVVFTNDHGTLTAPVDGTLDPATGEFDATSDTVTGTGDYATVTGNLHFWGVENLTDLTFTEMVHGKLCVPKKKQH
jgi:hypothetical protein